MAASLDGYIAQPNDDLSFLSIVEKEGEDYGYAEFMGGIDTVIVGRRTYDWVKQHAPDFTHKDKTAYIITRTQRQSEGNTHFYNGAMKELIARLKSKEGKNIFVDGGAQVVNAMLADKLIDEIIISYIPILVGNGTRLFNDGRPEQNLELISTKQFEKGLVQVHYRVL